MNDGRDIADATELNRLEALFFAALSQPVEQREAFLRDRCGSDQGLRRSLERLLEADSGPSAFLDGPHPLGLQLGAWARAAADDDRSAAPGALIGGYRLIEPVGGGGMGTVWRACRADDAFERTVAVKVIKRGMDSEEILRRFRLERQVLARLEHPNIARLYDAGVSADGRPYLVMEFIDGEPADQYCKTRGLGVAPVLELVQTMCSAIHFAHSNLILHRDIKPSNVLVSRDGQVKLLDFGIAKLLDPDGSSLALTSHQRAFTPRYASPEQVRGDRLTTASDVYSLGVLLFELLTGQWPYGPVPERMHELERVVCEREPFRPTQVVTRTPTTGRRLAADLDWIIHKCLAKEPALRYATALELAADLKRFLHSQPVLASPPSLAIRTRKFLRRNAAAVSAGAAIVFLLVTGTGVSIRFALREAEQRRTAVWAQSRADRQALLAGMRAADAALQAETARAVTDFLNLDLLGSIVPSIEPGRGRDVGMREVLDGASQRIEAACLRGGKFHGKPLIEAEIRATLADTYVALAEYELAEHHLTRALDLRRGVLGPHDPQTLESLRRLGQLLGLRGRLAEAEPLVFEAADVCEAVLGATDPLTLKSLEGVAAWLTLRGPYDSALEHLQSAYTRWCDTVGMDHPDTLAAAAQLGALLQSMGRHNDAEFYLRQALEGRRERLGQDHPATLASQHALGSLLIATGQYEPAVQQLRRALEGRRRVCGESHVDTLASGHDLGDVLNKLGRYEEALDCFQAALDGRRRALGEEHAKTLTSLRGLAAVLESLGRFADAEPLMRESLDWTRAQLGDDHPTTLDAVSTLGTLMVRMKRYEDAEPLLRGAAERRARVLGPDHPSTLDACNNLAALLRTTGRLDEAEPLVRDTLERRRRTLGDDHPSTLYSVNTLGVLLIDQKRYEEAEPLVREAYERRRDKLGENHPATLTAHLNLAGFYERTEQLEESLRHHEAILAVRHDTLGFSHADTLQSCSLVATVLGKLGRIERAERLAAQAADAARSSLPEGHFGIGIYLANHGKLLTRLGRFADAERELLEAHALLEAALGRDERRTVWARGLLKELHVAWDAAEPDETRAERARPWLAP